MTHRPPLEGAPTGESTLRGRRRVWSVLAVLGLLAGGTGTAILLPVAAGATASTGPTNPATTASARGQVSSSQLGAFTRMFTQHLGLRGVPGTGVGKLVPGSLRIGTDPSTGVRWGVASFAPSATLSSAAKTRFQDGGGTGVFEQRAGQPWQFVSQGVAPLGCDSEIPLAIRRSWGITAGVSCSATATQALSAATAGSVSQASAVGPVAARIVKVALGQVNVGDNPVTQNFSYDCNPYTTMTGPAPAAADSRGCGFSSRFNVEDEGEEWCSDFTSWVWQRAGITADTQVLNSGASSFYQWGAAHGAVSKVDSTDFKPGDAVVFYEPGLTVNTDAYADHVGTITAVHPNGTVDMVNGDFGGGKDISVQYDKKIRMRAFASSVWAKGEQWVLVRPPESGQPAAPSHLSISGPHLAATGTDVTFSGRASVAGGTLRTLYWAFGSGEYSPGGTATGSLVHHVFADPGRQTVTMTAISEAGAVTVKTWDVDVVAGSSSAATSIASNSIYYLYRPLAQQVFSNTRSRGVTEEVWDGATWLDAGLPGSFVKGGKITVLAYKDADDVQSPHVFGAGAGGKLIEAYQDGSTWKALELPGDPAPSSPVAAAEMTPEKAASRGNAEPYTVVFYYNNAGQLAESSTASGKWSSGLVPGAMADGGRSLATGTIQMGGPQLSVYDVNSRGRLVVSEQTASGWHSYDLTKQHAASPAGGLAAVSSHGTGQPAVFYLTPAGHLAQASPEGSATPGWQRSAHGEFLAKTGIKPTGGLAATEAISSGGTPTPEVAALLPGGGRVLAARTASGTWSERNFSSGVASHLLGLADYQVAGSGQQLVYATAKGTSVDSQSLSGGWSQYGLPDVPATFRDRVVLYAADGADYQRALQAAREAGIPRSRVTGNFYTAWAYTTSPEYLVIAVGMQAVDGLDFNACGWSNPASNPGGSSPFYEITDGPVDHLPGGNVFEPAGGTGAAGTKKLADGLAYYAVHGKLPAGITKLPARGSYADACVGNPNVH